MTVDKAVLVFAGTVVLLSAALAEYVSHAWLLLTVFAGLNMVQASFTGFCPAVMAFQALGMRPGPAFK